ncbi:amino acid adenylation domain-containing protein [Yinghuangia sp. YIM S09857]|uniref:non-ribosomal peptide synthetase n=1 Tax=Yinghuangia sp. YIM S09857 TaxID=3436929 RepID=UPI003F53D38F
MNITDLLADYSDAGITIWADDGRLRYRARAGAMTEERKATLRAHREVLLAHLTAPVEDFRITPDPAARHEPFPLTDLQAAYLVGRADAYEYGGVACHAYLELAYPDLDPDRVTAAWRTLLARHDMLRAVVHPDGYQEVPRDIPRPVVAVDDIRGQGASVGAAAVERTRAALAERDGHPREGLPHTVHVTRTDTGATLHLSVDLLTIDHASLRNLVTEFHTEYNAPGTLPAAPEVTFRDYVLARRALTESPGYERDRAYWLDRVDALPPAPELPLAEPWADPADTVGGAKFRRLETTVPAALWHRLRAHAAEHGVTPSGALLTAFAETVGRWSRNPRFTLNLPVVDRPPLHDELDSVVGEFTRIELLAVDLTADERFADRARTVAAQFLDDLAHPLFGGGEVLAEISRRTGSRVLMPVVFTSALGGGTVADVVHARTQTPQVWIDAQVMERGGDLALSWDVREGVLPAGLADDAFAAFAALVDVLATDPAAWELPARLELPPAQADRRAAANDTGGPVSEALLHEAFVAQAAATPHAVALRAADRDLTYRELLDAAEVVASRLTFGGQAPRTPVAILLDKGWEQIAAVLGTLLAGGAYLPIDVAQPALRRDAILRDAGVRLALTRSDLVEVAPLPEGVTAVRVDLLPAGGAATATLVERRDPDDLAYVIYTSGSTGTPKGVMISHRAALNTVADINRRFGVTADDRVLGVASLGFDLSVYDIFGPLAVGGALVLPNAPRRGDPSHWAELIAGTGVTVWNSVPGQLRMLLDWLGSDTAALGSLRLALLSGDWIPVPLPDDARAMVPGLEVVALGGATEGAIWSIVHPVGAVDRRRPSIPYGRPLTNQSFHVLDEHLRPRPDWVAGELYIGGLGVAEGYLGDAERTAERFVRHPVTGERLYRTGDLGRHLPDGDIEFLGREDAQVKIRGYRVELAEIEAAVHGHPAVGGCAVVVDGQGDGRRLAAFVEPARRDRPVPVADGADRAAAEAVREAAASIDGDRLTAFLGTLDEVALAVMSRTLFGAGLFSGDDAHTFDEICAGLNATARHRRLVRRWIDALVAEGRMREQANAYTGLLAVTPGDLAAAWEEAAVREREVDWSTELLDTMRTCADRVDALLDGSLDIRDLLFPGASRSSIESAYRDNLAVRHLGHGLTAALRAAAAAHVGERRLRVLEVAGGVGGTTTRLIPALAEYGVDYLFTDASPFFLAEARDRFVDHPWVRYGLLDIDQDPRTQGHAPNSYDVIVCADALHASTDAGTALSRLCELLAPGGRLAFVENTRDAHYPLMVSMEFLELTGSPWTDVRAATGQSFLTRDQWLGLLAEQGVHDTLVLPPTGDPIAATGQELFLASVKTDRVRTDADELARHTATRLPEYMVPAAFHLVDALPHTPNGKVDRARLMSWLPAETAAAPTASAPPADDLERELAALWSQLLAVEPISRDDDFFALGGDSLLVARMVGRLRELIPSAADLEWESVLRHMLLRPTVAGLAAHLRAAGTDRPPTPEEAPASPLVHLHGPPAGEGPVTVLVHAGTGTVMPYRALITEIRRRSPGRGTVLGLEIPGLDGYLDAPPDGLIEALAADYAKALAATGAEAFHLVGYCLGGLIATEVARGLTESGADVASLTVISSHSPRFRLDDEILSEYSFAVMMGIAPADLGFPADENAVAAAADAVLAGSPGVLRDGGIAGLDGEHAPVAACFRELGEVSRQIRVTRMCDAVPAAAGTYEPDHMNRLFRTFRQSVFAITRYQAEPYAGDITFLRHSGAYPFPGSRDAVTEHWHDLALGELRILDIPGDHFSCLSVDHAPGILKVLDDLTDGAVTR